MTVINTNVGALQARTYAVRADSNVTKAMERLSSGLRINSAADDAAGLAVANKMESQIRGMNMAIRNSQDGISLVQTAEAAMGEINNMVIRMRELAVQMNNGVYTDADRANAQLEVTALLAEIDKVADNSAFNQVKILDGTYSQDIRAGNTNPEVINVTIDRMNTDALGGGRVATGVDKATTDALDSTPNRALTYNTTVKVAEGRPVIDISDLAAGASYDSVSITGNPDSRFAIDSGNVTLNAGATNTELNYSTTGSNEYTFQLTFVTNGESTVENVTVQVSDEPVATSSAASASTMEVEESACVKIQASTELSDQVNEFIIANAGNITYGITESGSLTDVADAGFTINSSTGEILASLDFERPTGGTLDTNTYTFDVTVSNGSITMTETVTLNVTDYDLTGDSTVNSDEAVWATQSATVATTDTPSVSTGYTASNVVAENVTLNFTAVTNAAVTLDINSSVASLNAFEAIHDEKTTGSYTLVGVGSDNTHTASSDLYTIATGITLHEDTGAITVSNTAAVTTIEDVHIRYTADDGRTFDLFTDIVVNTPAASGTVTQTNKSAGGNFSQIDVQAGGEQAVLDLKAHGTAGDGVFDGIGAFYTANPCGIFTVSNVEFNGGTTGASALSVDNSGQVLLSAGAAAGTYTADVMYEDNEGDKYVQRIQLNVTEIGIRGENNIASQASTETAYAIAHDQSQPDTTISSSIVSEQVRGESNLSVNEARQGTIKSVGTTTGTNPAVLSSQFNSFVNTYTGGTFTITDRTGGTDAELFSIDASTGDIQTKGLVDFESKSSYQFNVTYTSGSNVYTEEVNLRVIDDTDDNTTHIANVDLGTQDGAATAVTILDKAINQITSSQAKLGAIQNRLQYNIDNLSKASMLTQTAKGRIIDADFAAETSELSKQQILSQAATSMLAQANQSKQSVLALLQ